MSLSTVTVTHSVKNADGTAGSGTVIFTLSKRITNGTTTILPAPVAVTLDSSGNLSALLYANNDPSSTPNDSQYRVDFHLAYAGSEQESFWIVVPYTSAGGSIDLGSLLPQPTIGGG